VLKEGPEININKTTTMPNGNNKKNKRTSSALAAARTVASNPKPKSMQPQLRSIIDPLTYEDEAVLAYATTVSDPWVNDPAGVPISLGFNAIRTLKPQLKFQMDIVANASGFAFLTVGMDGWIAGVRYVDHNGPGGGLPGYPIFYSDANYAGYLTSTATQIPPTNTSAATGVTKQALGFLDPQVNPTTKYRLVACGVRVFGDSSMMTTQGKYMLVSTSDPTAIGQGAVVGGSYASLYDLPDDLASVQTGSLSNLTGKSAHTFAVPSDPDCFKFDLPTNGYGSQAWPQIAVIMSGAAPNQSLSVEVVFDYEFTIGDTHITGVDVNPTLTAEGSRITNVLANINSIPRPGPMVHRPGQINLATGAHAALAEMATSKGPDYVKAVLANSNKHSFLSNLASSAVNFVSKNKGVFKKAISYVPYVGSFLSKLF
jgi:hypothetical protein